MNPSTPPEPQEVRPLFVLDRDVPLAWLLPNLGSVYTSGVVSKLRTQHAIVPGTWPSHLAESVREAEKRKLIRSAAADRFLTTLAMFRIVVDVNPHPHTWTDTLPLARSSKLKVADAAYLELARRKHLPLATISPRLLRVASTLAIPIYQP